MPAFTLAPLTAPKSRAKSRPLYLAPGPNGNSASYSDAEKSVFRGRKFYWKQRSGNDEVWQFHRVEDGLAHQDNQPRSVVNPLRPRTTFKTRIFFENLSHPELGALLFALLGPHPCCQDDGSWNSVDHCIHLGKGKPRGMGVCDVQAKVAWFQPEQQYASLIDIPDSPVASNEEVEQARQAFAIWCNLRASAVGQEGPFEKLPHIEDFIKLHTYPANPSVRYYPVNWSQYTWPPEENKNPDEPQHGKLRPPAMKLAHNLEP